MSPTKAQRAAALKAAERFGWMNRGCDERYIARHAVHVYLSTLRKAMRTKRRTAST